MQVGQIQTSAQNLHTCGTMRHPGSARCKLSACECVTVCMRMLVYHYVSVCVLLKGLKKSNLIAPISCSIGARRPFAMVDLPPGECSGCATCAATTMLHPGSASCKLPTDPCEVVLSGSAKSTLSADNVALLCFVMHFIY